MKNNLTGHMIVYNEEQWVWYAINSVLDYVDKIIIYDTGSTDTTVNIIRSIRSPKIIFHQKKRVTPKELAELRNDQIRETTTDWFLLLDGDEVWSPEILQDLVRTVRNCNSEKFGVVVKANIAVGDLFHAQSEAAGKYELLGKKGHFNMRAYRKSKTYHWEAVYPYNVYVEKYVDVQGVSIQERVEKLTLLSGAYWHMTHLHRSSKDTHHKLKYEIGKPITSLLPQIFFSTRPSLVPSPWIFYKAKEYYLAQILTPLLFIKRKLMS